MLRTADGEDALRLEVDGLLYVLDRAPQSGKKVVLTARVPGSDTPAFVDSAQLLAFRSRRGMARALAEHFGRETGQVMGHLALLLDQVERALAAQDKPADVQLTAERRERAEALLATPDLLGRAAKAFEALGYVGEEETKRLCYLVATSRLLSKPLSAILLAPSAAGKSDLLDKLTELLPAEAVEYLSRLTRSALYYAGPDYLRHKVVIVDEQAGASDADYSIRTLQTKGFLSQALSVGGRTERLEAHGPIALLSGSTSTTLDPENLSRCLELALDDGPEQTRRIHEAQRRAWAGERRAEIDSEVWQDAQRLLEPLDVVIPFAVDLRFPARTTRDRREQQKLLTLIASHVLLHQRQRERDERGRLLATLADYEAIHALVAPALESSLDGLSPRAARTYRLLVESGEALTRREIAALIGWNYMTSARALDELVAQELATVAERDPPRRYRALPAGGAALGGGLLTQPTKLGKRPARSRRRSQRKGAR